MGGQLPGGMEMGSGGRERATTRRSDCASAGSAAPDDLDDARAGNRLLRGLTSQLWVEGVSSSYFLEVKMSTATKWHLA